MALPLHRHQSSLEGLINFSTEPPLEAGRRAKARRRFYQIVNHFEPIDNDNSSNNNNEYNRPRLVRLTYEYARSEESKDNVLRAFFQSMLLPINSDEDIDFTDKNLEDEVHSTLIGFADYLVDNFFLPLKASTRKTPQPSPIHHSAVQGAQGGTQEFTGTPARISALRGSCLIRDRHRCVVTRIFNAAEAENRTISRGSSAQDDDGNSLIEESRFEDLEVAHILPHSLMKVAADSESENAKQATRTILNMFDNGVVYLIEGTEIDRPRNAITLTPTYHRRFSDFRIFFTPTADQQSHTYRIDSFLPPSILQGSLPVTRTLYLTETRTIDPPSPQLLAIHRAIAHILHLSAAGKYIDKILQDIEKHSIRADGSTELGRLLNLGLRGWLKDTVDVY
ncbi:hypothetical protein BDY21DRAFT_284527 [Lineolata rhizophorae]|uniref:HNH nuclease domain-containing protein n=1 Tax=Lineolata rhizophorae TaxID=578093 RepID=A0A6A6P2N9_9PEZI|nr:hypothetical protein BDY21DRAFT_284527 [Lineolata rhizophorae]